MNFAGSDVAPFSIWNAICTLKLHLDPAVCPS
jgi:hypothetical protein